MRTIQTNALSLVWQIIMTGKSSRQLHESDQASLTTFTDACSSTLLGRNKRWILVLAIYLHHLSNVRLSNPSSFDQR